MYQCNDLKMFEKAMESAIIGILTKERCCIIDTLYKEISNIFVEHFL